MNQPRILVITSCTGEKLHKPQNQLTQEDFSSKACLRKRERELRDFSCPAWRMYTGAQHLRLMEGLQSLRQEHSSIAIDLKILSAGYGLIDEDKSIVPYEVTFSGMKQLEIVQQSKILKIHQTVESAIHNYDLIFLLLGDNYLKTIELPIATHSEQTVIALCSYSAEKYFQKLDARTYTLPLSNYEAKIYSYGLVGLKGFLFRQAMQSIGSNKKLLEQIYKKPELFLDLIEPTRQLELLAENQSQSLPAVKLHPSYAEKAPKNGLIPIPEVPPAKNLAQGMRYFIPEWDDHVDPGYDFLNDRLTLNRDPYHDEHYAHEIYAKPNYDGILVSKTVLDKSLKKKRQLEEAGGIHNFLRYAGPIMGDCGAFSYITEEKPPYTTSEIIEYYDQYGFDLGVSVDHLIVGDFARDLKVRANRYDLTLDNAQDFLIKHQSGKYKFQPIGVAQGWDPESYALAVKELLSMGYKRIGIGGIARAQTREIIGILKAVREHLQPNTHLHLFGVARINAIEAFRHLGVTSFDSASALRQAWLDPKENYHTLSGENYTAVRIPQVDQGLGRVKKLITAGVVSHEQLKIHEKKALKAIRSYALGKTTLSSTLKPLTALDKLLASEVPSDKDPKKLLAEVHKHRERYQKLLEDRPWEKCDCPICTEIGAEVIIFRGNDRNRRRGFHNTYIFYKRFRQILEQLDNRRTSIHSAGSNRLFELSDKGSGQRSETTRPLSKKKQRLQLDSVSP
jgi:hypothetical protein